LESIHRSVINHNFESDPLNPLLGGERFKEEFHSPGIRPGKPARPQLGASIIPNADGNDLPYTPMEQSRKHGTPRGTVGLTVIAHSYGGSAPRGPGHEGPAVVCGIRELVSTPSQEDVGRFRIRGVARRRDEPAL